MLGEYLQKINVQAVVKQMHGHELTIMTITFIIFSLNHSMRAPMFPCSTTSTALKAEFKGFVLRS